MRALIVAGETRPIGQLGTMLVAQGYEVTFVAANAPELVMLARGAPVAFMDLRDGVGMVELACARLEELGEEAPFTVLYGEVPELQSAEHLLDGKVRAFLVPDAPMNHLRLRAFAGTIKMRRRSAEAFRELQRASEQTREYEDALRKLLDRMNDGALIHRDGKVLFMNARWAELTGVPDRAVSVGKSIFDGISPENQVIITPRIAEATKGTPMPARELRVERPDGSTVTALVHTFPTIFEGTPALLTHARDVSDQRLLEAKLIASNRMVALGRLAANVGHEVNNPLAFVMGSAERALSQLTNGEDRALALESVQNVLDGAARVQAIVRDLKVLSRPSSDELAPVEVATVLESCLRIAERSIRPRAKVKMNLLSRSRAMCNEARVGQVFLNLLLNAAEAIPEGEPEHHTITVTTEDRPPHVVITIADSGVGIPKEQLASIFEPFFTTKADGRGTGLGLSISHSLITAVGGRIEAESEAGKGTRMVVHLPIAEAPAHGPEAVATTGTAAANQSGARHGSARRQRILVVDDEVQLARLIKGFLVDYDVVIANSGSEARNLLDSGAPFDLVLCDLMMPDVTGMDLYEHVQKTKPDMCARFVFMTGGAFTAPAVAFLDAVAAKGNPCVDKPFRIDSLAATIASRLADGEKTARVEAPKVD